MRLIDVDKLTDRKGVFSNVIHVDFEKGGGYIMVEDLLNILDNQPTAYDVDKVIDQINNLRKPIPVGRTDRESIHNIGYGFGLNDSLKIVKFGGISKK